MLFPHKAVWLLYKQKQSDYRQSLHNVYSYLCFLLKQPKGKFPFAFPPGNLLVINPKIFSLPKIRSLNTLFACSVFQLKKNCPLVISE